MPEDSKTSTEAKPEQSDPAPAESDEAKTYTILHGQLESVYVNDADSIAVVKAKIEPNLTNRMTILQNYYNVCDLIKNQGLDSFSEVQYWAVADMTSGDESKVISFDVSKSTIDGIVSGTVLPNELEDYVDNLWILPSLK